MEKEEKKRRKRRRRKRNSKKIPRIIKKKLNQNLKKGNIVDRIHER